MSRLQACNAPVGVSATMMRAHVYNEYTVETGIKAATDWRPKYPSAREGWKAVVDA